MENRFIETVKKIDAVLILIACVAVIIFLIVSAFSMFGGGWYEEPPNQIIVADSNDPDEKVEVKETVTFYKSVKDVYVFSVSSTAINSDDLVEMTAESGFSMKNSVKSFNSAVANFIFVKDGVQKRLFDKNALIYKYSLANTDENDYPLSHDFNIYAVVNHDTNGDQLLNGMDNVSLYVSEYDGSGLQQISSSMFSFDIVSKNEFVFSEYDGTKETFYRFNRETGKKVMLTSVSQEVEEKRISMYD